MELYLCDDSYVTDFVLPLCWPMQNLLLLLYEIHSAVAFGA